MTFGNLLDVIGWQEAGTSGTGAEYADPVKQLEVYIYEKFMLKYKCYHHTAPLYKGKLYKLF